MTWWQIYFTAKVCCSSPLISLFLFFLSVILQEAKETDTFNDKQIQWKDIIQKQKQNYFAKILQISADQISKMFTDSALIIK